jgi:predicted RNase H-like nuclease (RuvC/YqgF family)
VSSSEVPETEATERHALSHLEDAVGRLLDEHAALAGRLRKSNARLQEVEATLALLGDDGRDMVSVRERVATLEAENRELRDRLRIGREVVERILSRLRFLEDQS